jgi:hypothetical protein
MVVVFGQLARDLVLAVDGVPGRQRLGHRQGAPRDARR